MYYQCLSSFPLPSPNVVPKDAPVISVTLDGRQSKLIYGQHSPLCSTAMPLQNLRSSPPQREDVHIKRTVSAIGPAPNPSKAFLVEKHLANVPFQSHPGVNLYMNMGLQLVGRANFSNCAKFGVAQQGFNPCLKHHSAPQRAAQSVRL